MHKRELGVPCSPVETIGRPQEEMGVWAAASSCFFCVCEPRSGHDVSCRPACGWGTAGSCVLPCLNTLILGRPSTFPRGTAGLPTLTLLCGSQGTPDTNPGGLWTNAQFYLSSGDVFFSNLQSLSSRHVVLTLKCLKETLEEHRPELSDRVHQIWNSQQ